MFNGGARIPHSVMPVVFGGAVTVTALFTIYSSKGKLQATPMLWVGIVGMLLSVIIITTNTPHAAPSPGSSPGESTSTDDER